MSFIASVLFVAGGGLEIMLLIACYDIFGVLHKNIIRKKRIFLSIITYIGISVMELFLTNNLGNSIVLINSLMYYSRLILTIGILYGYINRKIVYLAAFLDLSITLVETSISCILANQIGEKSNDVSPFVNITIQVLALIVVLFIKRKNNIKGIANILNTIPNHIFIMIIAAVICLSAQSSLIGFQTDNRIKKENTLIIIVIMLAVIFICVVISLFMNVIAKQHFTAVSQMMERQVELQISHYDNLEKMDAEMRKFRHDYTNHLKSILSLIRMNECSQAEEYIDKIQNTEYKFHTPMFYTGNRLADAILSEKSVTLDAGCRIEYSGIISSSIENVDLCIILSNALDNAIEACRVLQTQYVISIFAGKQQGYFVLSIKNPTACSEKFYEIPPTSKSDKTQHGMGLYNIESAVKKYDGQMKIKCENEVFELIITMKI